MTDRLGRADLHIHTLASDGTSSIIEILDHVEAASQLDVIAITDHERVDAALAARDDRPRPRGSLRGRRRRGDHDPGRPPPGAVHREPGQAVPITPIDDRRGPRPRRPGRPGTPPRPVSAVCPGVRAPAAARRIGSALPPGRARDIQSRPRSAGRATRAARGSRPSTGWRRSATATPTQPRRSPPAGRRIRGAARTTCAGRSSPGRRTPTAASTPRAARCRCSGGSSASTAGTCGTRSAGGSAGTGPVATTATREAAPGHPGTRPTRRRTRSDGEDRARHAVCLPGPGWGQRARPLPVREPPAARPRRPDHQQQPRPPARLGGRRHPPRQGLQRADERIGRDGHGLAPVCQPGRRHARSRAVRRAPLPRAVRAVPVARSSCAAHAA